MLNQTNQIQSEKLTIACGNHFAHFFLPVSIYSMKNFAVDSLDRFIVTEQMEVNTFSLTASAFE